MIRLVCPQCQSVLKAPARLEGQFSRCAKCGGRFLVPKLETAPAAPTLGSTNPTSALGSVSVPAQRGFVRQYRLGCLIFAVVLGGLGLVGLALAPSPRSEEVHRADREPRAEREDAAPIPGPAAEKEREEQARRPGFVAEEIESEKPSRLKPVPDVPDDEPRQPPESGSRHQDEQEQQPKTGPKSDAPSPAPRPRQLPKVPPKGEDRTEGRAKPADQEQPLKSVEELEKIILDLTNKARAKEKLPALKLNTVLAKTARAHSANQARQEKMAHELDGKNPGQRIRESGYQASSCGENVGTHSPGDMPQAIFDGWMSSPGHRANILKSSFTEIGVGVARSEVGNVYYTQAFGTPAEEKPHR